MWFSIEEARRKLTNAYYIDIYSHAHVLEKEKEQAQQPPSLHGRSFTPNSGKKRRMSLEL